MRNATNAGDTIVGISGYSVCWLRELFQTTLTLVLIVAAKDLSPTGLVNTVNAVLNFSSLKELSVSFGVAVDDNALDIDSLVVQRLLQTKSQVAALPSIDV